MKKIVKDNSIKSQDKKAFGLWSAVFLGIGSMVGAGIFIVIGQAGAIAGNLVWLTFVIGGIIALLSGYSLAKLALRYPSRGGIIEYLVQGYGEGFFSGSLGVLFYLSQLVSLAAVSKSFGTYAATYMGSNQHFWTNCFGIGIIVLFTLINLIGATWVAKSENIIVIVKLAILITFTIAASFYIDPDRLKISEAPPIMNIFYALGLVFFAYQGFSVITNSVEDMESPQKTMLKAMIISIMLVAVLYISVSIVVLGNLSLPQIIEAKDYALAEAAKPAFGQIGFKIMAAAALIATASAINATLYAVSEISYTLAKNGALPKEYEYHVFNNSEGLLISAACIVPMIMFMTLDQITIVAAIAVLLIQGFTHIGHFLKKDETGANIFLLLLAIVGMFSAAFLAIDYTRRSMPHIVYYLLGAFLLAYMLEVVLRLFTGRVIQRSTPDSHFL